MTCRRNSVLKIDTPERLVKRVNLHIHTYMSFVKFIHKNFLSVIDYVLFLEDCQNKLMIYIDIVVVLCLGVVLEVH